MSIPPISTMSGLLYILMLAGGVILWVGVSMYLEQRTRSLLAMVLGFIVYVIGCLMYIVITETYLFPVLTVVALIVTSVLVAQNAWNDYTGDNNNND